jgi:hypothetical protein
MSVKDFGYYKGFFSTGNVDKSTAASIFCFRCIIICNNYDEKDETFLEKFCGRCE